MLRPLQTFNVADIRFCNETLNLANISMPYSKRSIPPRLNSHIYDYVYAYSNDIHNLATIALLSQQFFTVLFFLIKFKTLGLMVESDLATKLCAKVLSSKCRKFFPKCLVVKSY